MHIKLFSKWGELPIADNSRSASENLIFPGAEIKVSQNNLKGYCYLFQQFETQLLIIRYCSFFSSEKDSLTVVTDPAVTFRFGVNHSHRVVTKYLGKQLYHARNYNCFYDPYESVEYPLEPNEKYTFLDILLKEDYSLYLQQAFPALNELMAKVAVRSAGKLSWHNKVAQIEIWRWHEDLKDWCFNKARDLNTGHSIVYKLIEKSIVSANSAPVHGGVVLSQNDINKIYEVAGFICSSDKEFTSKELAEIVGLSEYKLNAGFKEIFGHSVLKHRFEEKMMLALRLIDNKEYNSKQVAGMLGYRNVSNFSRDFKKRFGYCPYRGYQNLQKIHPT